MREGFLIKEIDYNSDEYHQAVALRQEILRTPLGLQLTAEDIQWEANHHHIAAFDKDMIVGCLILTPLNSSDFMLRQFAVSQSRQKSGIGRQLIKWAEEFSTAKNAILMTMSAREGASGFYEKMGYTKVGDRYMADIQAIGWHYKMEKTLQRKD
jgi:predicted GNAT family N-acyltransferase